MFTLKDACCYSIEPHKLGLCGPQKNCVNILKKHRNRRILKEFPAVYHYCKIIAKQRKIKNPLADEVLEIYWLGGIHNYHVWRQKPFNKKIKLTNKLKSLCQVSVKKINNKYYTYHWGKKIQSISKTQAQYLNELNKCLNQK